MGAVSPLDARNVLTMRMSLNSAKYMRTAAVETS